MSNLPSREEMQATIDYAITRTLFDGTDAKLIAFARLWVSGRLVDREAIDYEALAAAEHAQWAHWTAYMLDNLTDVNMARWRQQIDCPYEALTEPEKESDREWARKAIVAAIGDTK